MRTQCYTTMSLQTPGTGPNKFLTEAQAKQKVLLEAEVVCSTLSSCIAIDFIDAELKYDVRIYHSVVLCSAVAAPSLTVVHPFMLPPPPPPPLIAVGHSVLSFVVAFKLAASNTLN